MSSWPGPTRERLSEMAEAYEVSVLIAAAVADRDNSGNTAAACAYFLVMREGIRIAVADELRRIGCPDSEVDEWANKIIEHQCEHRMAKAREHDANGRSSKLH